MFGEIKIEKCKFHYHKNLIDDVDKILISNKVCFGKMGYKYFTCYKDDNCEAIPLCMILPKISRYKESFNESKYVLFV